MFGVSILYWGLKMNELAFRHSALLAERQPYNHCDFIENNIYLYRTSDFSVLHTYKQAMQTLNVNFIT